MRLSFIQETLLAAAAGLSFLLIVEVWLVLPESLFAGASNAADSSVAAGLEDSLAFVPQPRSAFRAFIERPLFEKSRRPVADLSAPEGDAVEISDLTLVGIIFMPNEHIAILRAGAAADPVRAKMGDVVKGWRILEIAQTSVLLRHNESVQWLSLPDGG